MNFKDDIIVNYKNNENKLVREQICFEFNIYEITFYHCSKSKKLIEYANEFNCKLEIGRAVDLDLNQYCKCVTLSKPLDQISKEDMEKIEANIVLQTLSHPEYYKYNIRGGISNYV